MRLKRGSSPLREHERGERSPKDSQRPAVGIGFEKGSWAFSPLNAVASAGFTLVEVMIAVAIFALAFASITQITTRSSEKSYMAGQLSIVAMLARNKMIETEYETEGKQFTDVDKEKEGAFEGPFKNFRWKRKIKEIEFPTLGGGGGGDKDKSSGGDAQNNEQAANVTKMVTNYLSKSVREVTVSIIWKRGKSDQTYSVTTYWVDLNHEFNPTSTDQ